VHLVVHDQTPVLAREELEVLELAGLGAPPGEHLVGRDRHRADALLVAGVLAHLVGPQVGLVQQLLAPLAHRDRVGGQHQRLLAHQAHHAQRHDGLAGAAGQHDHAVAAGDAARGVEGLGRVRLVGAQAEGPARARIRAQLDRELVADQVAAAVVHRVADLDQRLLDRAARERREVDAPVLAQHQLADALVAQHVGQRVGIIGDELEALRGALDALDAQQAVAPDPALHLVEHVARHRHAGEVLEDLRDALGGHADRGRVPDRDRRDAVGVQVVRALLQLGEERQLVARLGEARVLLGQRPALGVLGRPAVGIDLRAHRVQHQRAVALHDQRVVEAHHRSTSAFARARRERAGCSSRAR
jgi:hypothetical protein